MALPGCDPCAKAIHWLDDGRLILATGRWVVVCLAKRALKLNRRRHTTILGSINQSKFAKQRPVATLGSRPRKVDEGPGTNLGSIDL